MRAVGPARGSFSYLRPRAVPSSPGGAEASEFLASQPPKPIAAIARAAANIIDTRRDRLFALAARFDP